MGLVLGAVGGTVISSTAFLGGAPSAAIQHRPLRHIRSDAYNLHREVRCSKGNVLAVYAHQDDGIYFMNPDLQRFMMRGDCITVLQLTAGDDGQGNSRSPSCAPIGQDAYYWVCRELGEEAAFGEMAYLAAQTTHVTTASPTWDQGYWQDPTTHQYITDYWIASDPKITILNLALPDGSPFGTGFPTTGHQSLWYLYDRQIPSITSLDAIASNPGGYASWTRNTLGDVIANVYLAVRPHRINIQDATLAPDVAGGFVGTLSGGSGYRDTPIATDHSDHIIGAQLALRAVHEPQFKVVKHWEVVAYEDYPNATNVAGFSGIGPSSYAMWDAYKWDAFAAYAPYDKHLPCSSESSCSGGSDATRQVYLELQGEWIRGEWARGLGF